MRLLFLFFLLLGMSSAAAQADDQQSDELRVMTWNIWHGGREDGEQVGPRRVVDVIRESGADLVAMQETYGSGEQIASALGFHFHPRGTNLSIHSRYPVIEDISVYEEFKCVGALVELPDKRRVALYSIWLPYDEPIWKSDNREKLDDQALRNASRSSAADLAKIRDLIAERLSDPKYANTPVVIAGDFNSMSHLDYGEVARDQYHRFIEWPTSQVLTSAGYRDSYRETNPVIDRMHDRTWSPRFTDDQQERIDYVYYRDGDWRAVESRVIDQHAEKFPSDHAAVLTTFRRSAQTIPADGLTCRVVSYNIHHGAGMDSKVDIARIGRVLESLEPDFVGLQEVDLRCARSGNINQAAELSKQLNMHAAFGTFMEYDGGHYGLAVLSRYPIVEVQQVSLPVGEEPRSALVAKVLLPNGDPVLLVDVHFDYIADDTNRFSQATKLVNYLDDLSLPYILLGDFNDLPDSRTMSLFPSRALEATKPPADPFTFSSIKPVKEIDYIFAAPKTAWRVAATRVVDEPVASDHRPFVAELKYQQPKASISASE